MYHAYILCTLIFLQGYVLSNCSSLSNLLPEKTIYNEELQDKQSRFYQLENLITNAKYEVRISYQAIIPTDFLIEIIRDGEKGFQSRHLLNVEQLQFYTETDEHLSYLLKVTAHRTGVPIHRSRLSDPVHFNIVLNRLYFGLTYETWKLVAILLVMCYVAWKYMVPYFILQVENFVNEAVDGENKSGLHTD